jgi:DNA invertase Pin-like site-specific DNA recombinase
MPLIGYARVSSEDQSLDIQIKQLTDAGCVKVFSEKKSGTNLKDRSELAKCLQYVRDGDVLMVTRIDRMARSMADFFKTLAELKEKGTEFRCLLQPEIDTTTVNGRLVTGILAAIAEFETAVRKERQREGIDAARARGVYSKKTVGNGIAYSPQKMNAAGTMLKRGFSYAEVALKTGISDDTLRRRFPGFKEINYPIVRAGSEPPAWASEVIKSPEALGAQAAHDAKYVETDADRGQKPGLFDRFFGRKASA